MHFLKFATCQINIFQFYSFLVAAFFLSSQNNYTENMKGLFVFLRRFVSPYKRNLVLSVLFNLLSAILNVFSFALIVPILELLFKINKLR